MEAFRRTSFVILSGVALGALTVASARAQTQESASATANRGEGQRYAIAPGPLGAALAAWSRQSGQSIIYKSGDVEGRRTAGVKGRLTPREALDRLLAGTGFAVLTDASGAIALLPVNLPTAGRIGGATPDILVQGRRSWSLNTGIKRSQDDSQPFIVMTGEEIERSGAPNLETFLRDRLNVNADPTVSERTPANAGAPGALPTGRGLSSVNLRGLGTRDTLILIDGRRQPGVNVGNGNLNQTQISGIPIASIERIEVLASSASGIYGSGASGGVINIVTKRDFSGGQITARYGNTTDFFKGEAQVDVTYGVPLEGGRTRLSLIGSWQKGEPLLYGEREAMAQRYRDQIVANNPGFFDGTLDTPIGTAVNYRTQSGAPLRLKPAFGGATLGSSFGTVPAGYRGVAADGISGLLSGVGRFTLDRPETAIAPGLTAPLLYGSERLNGSLTLRREFNHWFTGYISLTAARSESTTPFANGPSTINLGASARNNPFTNSVTVVLPGVVRETMVGNVLQQRSVLGGAIVKLPYGWQAALDMSFAASEFQSDTRPPSLSNASAAQLSNGAQDVLRDVRTFPLSLIYPDLPFGSRSLPAKASTFAPSLRLAGPLPLTLGGGRPQMTVNFGYDVDRVGRSLTTGLLERFRNVSFMPSSIQRTGSIYGEIALPLVGRANRLPLVHEFELRLSARAESYSANGSQELTCFVPFNPNDGADPFSGCPGPNDQIVRATTERSRIDPSVSFRWFPIAPIMLRGSYTTGYLPPQLSQLIRTTSIGSLSSSDPERGNQPIGVIPGPFGFTLPVSLGGNPTVRPESSRTFSLGAVVQPQGSLDGLRLSADWTRVKKRDVYFDPLVLGISNDPQTQALFATYLRTFPDRVTRGPASDGFAVGPITSLDLSLVNLNGLSTEAIDFVAEYSKPLFGGTLDINARATTVLSLLVDSFPGLPTQELSGTAPSRGFATIARAGALRWRGNGWTNWTKGPLTVGWAVRYLDHYRVPLDVVVGQGSLFVASQTYHDVNVTYRFERGITVNASISNLFDTKPPLDASAYPQFYSAYADPRLRNFFLSVTKSF